MRHIATTLAGGVAKTAAGALGVALLAAAAPPPAAAQVVAPPGADAGVPAIVRSVDLAWAEPAPIPVDPAELALRPGAVYDLARLRATEYLILRRLAEAGFPFGSVGGEVQREDGFVDLRIVVRTGPRAAFGPVQVIAETPVREAEVRERLVFREGEPFSLKALEHSSERVAAIPVVEQVTVHAVPVPVGDSLLAVTFAVGTGEVRGVGLEGVLSSSRCLEGQVGWWNRHLFGAPRTISLSVGGANVLAGPLRRFPCTGAGEGAFSNPDYFLRSELRESIGPATWLILGGEFSRLSEPQAYIRRGAQVRLGIAHQVARGLQVTGAFAPERREHVAGGVLHCAVYGVCDPIGVRDLERPRTHLPLDAGVTWASPRFAGALGAAPGAPIWLQPAPLPWRFSGRASLVGAGLTDFTYAGAVLEGSAARVIGPRFEAATRLRLGAILDGGEPVPPQVRLFGGGVLGVRGVPPNLLGPRVLTATRDEAVGLGCTLEPGGCEGVAVDPRRVRSRPTGGNLLVELSLEGRLAAARWLQLALFVDFGAIHSGALPAAPARIAASEGIVTPGIGVMIVSPVGPVRVDLALNPSSVPRRYPLLTPDAEGEGHLFLGSVLYDPFTFDQPSRTRELWHRIQFQLSMGPPF